MEKKGRPSYVANEIKCFPNVCVALYAKFYNCIESGVVDDGLASIPKSHRGYCCDDND